MEKKKYIICAIMLSYVNYVGVGGNKINKIVNGYNICMYNRKKNVLSKKSLKWYIYLIAGMLSQLFETFFIASLYKKKQWMAKSFEKSQTPCVSWLSSFSLTRIFKDLWWSENFFLFLVYITIMYGNMNHCLFFSPITFQFLSTF